jgi:hypothetical protein
MLLPALIDELVTKARACHWCADDYETSRGLVPSLPEFDEQPSQRALAVSPEAHQEHHEFWMEFRRRF